MDNFEAMLARWEQTWVNGPEEKKVNKIKECDEWGCFYVEEAEDLCDDPE